MSKSAPQVSCIILNWNNYPDTRECIESLQQISYDELEIIVVENGSTDGSGDRIAGEFEAVEVIFNDQNLGFGGGNNVGIKAALTQDADYIWILNNDTALPEGQFLNRLLKTFQEHPDAGIVSPRIYHYPDTDNVWFEKGKINWSTGYAYHVNKSNWFVDWDISGHTQQAGLIENDIVSNDYVPFCSAIIRAEVFEDVGLLPEKYFLYKEDADLCTQTIEHGYTILTNKKVELHHYVSQSTGGTVSPVHSYYTSRSMWLFMESYRDRINFLIFVVWYGWWLATRIGYNTLRRNWGSIKASVQGAVDGIQYKKGKGPYP